MSDFDPIQYCADGMDITSSPYAEQDATEIRAWTETGDLIACVEMGPRGGWTTDDGKRIGRGLTKTGKRQAALEHVQNAARAGEIPWEDESRWTDFDFEPIQKDADTGQPPEGTDYLYNLRDGSKFTDRDGREFTKVADGPMQGACVVERDGMFAHWMGDQIFTPKTCTDCGCETLAIPYHKPVTWSLPPH